jgi:hypothetical protein
VWCDVFLVVQVNACIGTDKQLVDAIRDIVCTSRRGPAFAAVLVALGEMPGGAPKHDTIIKILCKVSRFMNFLARSTSAVVQTSFGVRADNLVTLFKSSVSSLKTTANESALLRDNTAQNLYYRNNSLVLCTTSPRHPHCVYPRV